jgi:1-pyrroline-5-carboxylate dehydrogenase
MSDFQLTYATMFDPPEELHDRFEEALEEKKAQLGKTYSMMIGGQDVSGEERFPIQNPANQDQTLAYFPSGAPDHAHQAVAAAKEAFPAWKATPWQERVEILQRAADLIDERVFQIAAATTLEVGKNRMEALGDVSEAPALIRYAADQMLAWNGFITKMGEDPLEGYQATNFSVLQPYGVWLVISPFNFPSALTGGPVGAALLAGNTVVAKPAAKTSWTVRLLLEAFQDAGLPAGVLNLVTGSGRVTGQALVDHPGIDGVTFTGSYDVGMSIYRQFAQRDYVHPVILELGGKNPSIVSRHADLNRAARGIVRSAFGLQGQKCSANSRVYIEEPVYEAVVREIVHRTQELKIGDPGERETFLGPVIDQGPYHEFKEYTEELSQAGAILTGGKALTEGAYSKGFYVEPTVVADVPLDHPLWKTEMFLPITMVQKVDNLEEALQLANDVPYGLTSGFYGSDEEAQWYFDRIQAGVNYANRPQGSTTGAWPGYQPFGGWKASGSTGVNAGGPYYLQRYMREQVRTFIE